MRPLTEAPPLDFNDVVRAAVDATRPGWTLREGPPARRIEIEIVAGDLPPVAGEASVLIEAVTAVFMNAIEALPDGGTITVKTWVSDRHVHCAVIDHGVGMSPGTRRRALEPFFTTKAGEHKGLGLNVAYGLLHRHGGDLDLGRAEDSATVVTVRLPAISTAAG